MPSSAPPCFARLHSQESISLASLTQSCRGELGAEALGDCSYAFQLFDMVVRDPPKEEEEEEPEEEKHRPWETSAGDHAPPPPRRPSWWESVGPCVAQLFGVDADGRSVLLEVQGFEPSFLLELPSYIERYPAKEAIAKAKQMITDCLRGAGSPPYRVDVLWAPRLSGYVPPLRTPIAKGDPTVRRFRYARLHFSCVATFQHVQRAAKRKYGVAVCEERVPLTLKLADAVRRSCGVELKACGWVGIRGVPRYGLEERPSWCDVELQCDLQQVRSLPDINRLAPLLVASFDIECLSASGAFPDASLREDPVVVIGTTYRRVGELPSREGAPNIGGTVRTSHVLGDCGPVEGLDLLRQHCPPTHKETLTENVKDPNNLHNYVEKYVLRPSQLANRHMDAERALLDAWSLEIGLHARPDCIMSYNGKSFDFPYLIQRAEFDSRCVLLSNLSKLRKHPVEAKKKTLSSKAMGDNEVLDVLMPGCFELDMFQFIKNRITTLKSLKLDDVSREILGGEEGQKIQLPYSAIGVAFGTHGTPEQRAEVVTYCARDCDLPLRLAEKLMTIQETTEMSRVCHTLVGDMLRRGQQIKVYSHLFIAAHHEGCVMNDPPTQPDLGDEKYTGATVLDPKPGFYHEDAVVTMDFASLYPSIMRAQNLCWNTWVTPGTRLPPWVKATTHHFSEERHATFVDRGVHRGVLPKVLEALLGARKATRKRLKTLPKGSAERALLDGRQLAYKDIAETTTFVGRTMIEATKRLAETRFDANVIYGDTDSIMAIFPRKRLFPTDTEEQRAARGRQDIIEASFTLGEEAAQAVTDYFGDSINELECEKISFPYLLLGKKTYAAKVYETPQGAPKLDVKGLAVVRRDTCEFAADVLRDTLDALVMKGSVDSAREVVATALGDLVDGRVPFEKFVLSKRLSGTYASENLVQVAVVKKMEERAPGSAPKSGDRIQFVYVNNKNDNKAKAFEKAEDATYAREMGLKIDRKHYLTQTLVLPVCQLFEAFDPEPKAMFRNAIQELDRQQQGQPTIFAMMGHSERSWNDPPKTNRRISSDEGQRKQKKQRLAQTTLF